MGTESFLQAAEVRQGDFLPASKSFQGQIPDK